MIEEVPAFSIEWWHLFFAGLSTLAIFSFLFRENQFYRFFEHLFIGIATSYVVVANLQQFLYPDVLKPLLGWNRTLYPDGTWSEPYDQRNLLWLLPIAFGLLYYAILSKRHKWLAQLVIGCQLGYAGGLAFKGFFVEFMPQLFDSFRPLFVPASFASSFANIIFLLTLLCSLAYFFFTIKPARTEQQRSIGEYVVPGVLLLLWIAALLAWRYGPLPGDVKGTELVFLYPLAVLGALSYLGAQSALGPQYGLKKKSSLIIFAALSATSAVVALWVWVFIPQLLLFPNVNFALTLTLLGLIAYLLMLLRPANGGIVESSSTIGRWLMMGCFGAFFGSTIMARMALLVERLQFLIEDWFPLFS